MGHRTLEMAWALRPPPNCHVSPIFQLSLALRGLPKVGFGPENGPKWALSGLESGSQLFTKLFKASQRAARCYFQVPHLPSACGTEAELTTLPLQLGPG